MRKRQLFQSFALLVFGQVFGSDPGQGPWSLPSEERRAAATAEADPALPGIEILRMAGPMSHNMDEARVASRVNAVQGWGPQAVAGGVTGKGVLVGIIDREFDAWHPAFRDAKGASRFAAIWDQMKTADGTGPFGYGRLRRSAQLATDTTFGLVGGNRSGTAVASIAAGSDPSNAFYGVAPEATLLGAVMDYSLPKVMNAMEWMFHTADSLGMPCVINISFGSMGILTDGSSTLAKYIDSITGPGRIIVQSAGNGGGTKNHIKLALSSGQPVGTWVRPKPNSDSVLKFTQQIQFYGDPGKPISFTAKILDTATGTTITTLEAVSTASAPTYKMDTLYWNNPATGTRETLQYQWWIEAAERESGRANFMFILKTAKERFRLGISLTGTGTASGWGFGSNLESRNMAGYQNGDDAGTVNTEAGKNSIAVGSYTTKTSFINWMGETWGNRTELRGQIAFNSSRGPMLDGRIKPDICAPGALLITAYSSGMWLGQTSYPAEKEVAIWPKRTSAARLYGMFSGTSAAAPMVTGAVALMLQKKPKLSQLQARDLLQATAYKDQYTGPLTSLHPTWGAGKLDVAAALLKLESLSGLPDRVAEKNALRGFWSGNKLVITGWAGKGARGSLSDWRGRRVAELRPSGPAAWTTDKELTPGIYMAAMRGPGGTMVVKVAKE
jgi:minor extracellular serine protease Vpr